jgi:Xaa-Pro aminopeptidase
MASQDKGQLQGKISRKELERRWRAVRQAMKESNLDFLIMQNYTDILGGYVKWFTDMPATNNYPFTVIFPREEEMTIIIHGPDMTVAPNMPGIKKQISVPALPSLGFTRLLEGKAAVAELPGHVECNIGLVGMSYINAAFYNHITSNMEKARFSDATDLVDKIKAIKSDEEIANIRYTSALQDATFQYILSCIKPGVRDYEVRAMAMQQVLSTGSDQVNLGIRSAPAVKAVKGEDHHDKNRIIEEGDLVLVLIESNGPSGLYAEIIRAIYIGNIPAIIQEHHEVALKAQDLTLKLLKPGQDPLIIWKEYNSFLKGMGYQEEKRLLAHGMGYDMVERPSVQPGEVMKIEAGMNIAAHANAASINAFVPACENYLITSTGNERLHKTPRKVFTLS